MDILEEHFVKNTGKYIKSKTIHNAITILWKKENKTNEKWQ